MNAIPQGLVIFGFGGHARSVADVALTLGIKSLVFVEETAKANEGLWGFPVCKTFDGELPAGWQSFAASGDNQAREAQVAMIRGRSWPLGTLIAPTSTICNDVRISDGCFVAHHAHIGPLSHIGAGCIVNTGALIDHECKIGDYTHVSVNSTVAGRCELGRLVFLGAGAVVIDKVSIADSIIIGAGSVVVERLVEPGTYVGAPARPIKVTAARELR